MSAKSRKLNLLCIEDDEGCQAVMRRFLSKAGGHKVESAFSGAEGLEKAVACGPDLIVLDLGLPDMDGLEVLKKLYADDRTSLIPIIVVSGRSFTPEYEKALIEFPNFRLFEEKPASFGDLLSRIEALCAADSGVGSMTQ